MSFRRYVLRRVVAAFFLVYVVSSAALLLTIAAPGDVLTTEEFGRQFNTEEIARRRTELGLDRPVLVQYADWMMRVARFDFGDSSLYKRPVIDLLAERAVNTAMLATTALVAATLVGIPLGLYTGIRQRGFGVRLIQVVSLLFVSTPSLLASLALILLASRAHWPLGGTSSAGADDLALADRLLDRLQHMVLPALALALPLAAVLERLQSRGIAGTTNSDFVRAAQARGLAPDRARLIHGWRGSLGTWLGFYGVLIGTIFSGSFIVESLMAWPGLGRLMYDAIGARDLYLVAGAAAAGAAFLAAGTLLSDLMLAIADPRVYLEGTS
jgi:peptide/nickel transport system permease protein